MNRFASAFVITSLSLLVAAAACSKKDKEGAGAATATASGAAAATGAASASGSAPGAATASGSGSGSAAAPTPVALTAGAVGGPFASIDAYCDAVEASFVKDRCWSEMDQMEMCSCGAAEKGDVEGNVSAGGKSPNLAGAQLVAVADASADYVHCSVALQLANGWHVLHRAFPCNAAPVSHDGGISVTVNSFNILDDKLTLAWTAEDGDGKKSHTLDCTAAAPDQATCAPPTTK